MKFHYVPLLVLAGLVGCNPQPTSTNAPDSACHTQGNTNRMAAEWEPAAVKAWPLAIPYKLVVELAHDSRLITLVPDEQAGREARRWYARWGIDTTRARFAVAAQGVGAWWVRHWGPTPATAGTIEYYATATSASGRSETLPRTAPAGFYRTHLR